MVFAWLKAFNSHLCSRFFRVTVPLLSVLAACNPNKHSNLQNAVAIRNATSAAESAEIAVKRPGDQKILVVLGRCYLTAKANQSLFVTEGLYVKDVMAQPGDKVAAGEIVVRLSDPVLELEVQNLKQQYNLLKNQLDTIQPLNQSKVISRVDYEQVKSAYLERKVTLETALERIRNLELRASHEGTVEFIGARKGDFVGNFRNKPLVRLTTEGLSTCSIDLPHSKSQWLDQEHSMTYVKLEHETIPAQLKVTNKRSPNGVVANVEVSHSLSNDLISDFVTIVVALPKK